MTETTTYRAAYFVARNGDLTVLTGPEHAGMSDDDLRAEALAEALRLDILDADETDAEIAWPRLTRAAFDAGLHIGEY